MDDKVIDLIAKLDINKSKRQLQADIDKIKGQIDFAVKVKKIKLDESIQKSITAQLDNLKISLNDMTVSKEPLSQTVSEVNNALKGIQVNVLSGNDGSQQAKQAGQQVGQKYGDGFAQGIKNNSTKFSSIVKNQFKQVGDAFKQTFSIAAIGMTAISKTKEAITELKQINTYLTEISKDNDKLTASELKEIGDNSFNIASKYGKKPTDYLSGVKELYRAGYRNAERIAELSVAAQGAGDMTAELANKYIITTDKAYKLGGSVEKLMEILDGSNNITNHNVVNMTQLAEGMAIVGSQAANAGVGIEETTASLGTMIAATQRDGSEVAQAFKAILMNIQQVTDEEEGIDAEGLTKYERACAALNVSLKETKNGIASLRDPMQVIKELSEAYVKLDENDIRRTNLLSSVGGKLRANALDALLQNQDMYNSMLEQYAQGTGTMAAEAEKTANSWEGSLNRLSNTWTDTVENVTDSDAIITAINGLNGILFVINKITEALGSWGTIGAGIGIAASIKNVGRPKMFGLFEYADSNKCSYGYISFLNAEYGTYIFVNEASICGEISTLCSTSLLEVTVRTLKQSAGTALIRKPSQKRQQAVTVR